MEVALPKEQSVTPKDEAARLGRALGVTPDYVTIEFEIIVATTTVDVIEMGTDLLLLQSFTNTINQNNTCVCVGVS